MIRFTVVTITYNAEAVLQRTLDSVFAQTYKGVEHLIIDGASTDDTLRLVDDYIARSNASENGHRIQVTSEPDKGIYDAINKGLRHARGEWVACMNAGDTFADNDILRRVFSHPIPLEKDFIYSDYLKKSPTGEVTRYTTDRHRGEVFHQSCIYRRRLHEQHGYYAVTHPYIVSDLLFFLQVPEESFMKVDFPISLSEESGVSSGLWCREQALSLRVVFGIESLSSAFLKYWLTRIKNFFPTSARRAIKKMLGWKKEGKNA